MLYSKYLISVPMFPNDTAQLNLKQILFNFTFFKQMKSNPWN